MAVSTIAGGYGTGLATAVDLRAVSFGVTTTSLFVFDYARYGSFQSISPTGSSRSLREVDRATGQVRVAADASTPNFRPEYETPAVDYSSGRPYPLGGDIAMSGGPDGS